MESRGAAFLCPPRCQEPPDRGSVTPVTANGESSIQVQVDVPSCETSHSARRALQKGTLVSQSLTVVCLISCPSRGCSCCRESQHSAPMIMPSSLIYSCPPWLLRWWQRAVARIQIYWCNLLWTSEGVNRGLCMSSLKSPDWVCPSFSFFFLVHLNSKGMSNISRSTTKEVKYKTSVFR